MIQPYQGDKILVIGEKGLSTFSAVDGTFIKNSIYKKSDLSGQIANILLMQADDNYAAYNLDDLSYKEYKAKKGAEIFLEREDAEYLYVYEKKGVTKLKTR